MDSKISHFITTNEITLNAQSNPKGFQREKSLKRTSKRDWREICCVIWVKTKVIFDASVFFFFQRFFLQVLLLTMLDFLSIQLLLIVINNHSCLGGATFKLQPLKLVTDHNSSLLSVLTMCFFQSSDDATYSSEPESTKNCFDSKACTWFHFVNNTAFPKVQSHVNIVFVTRNSSNCSPASLQKCYGTIHLLLAFVITSLLALFLV